MDPHILNFFFIFLIDNQDNLRIWIYESMHNEKHHHNDLILIGTENRKYLKFCHSQTMF